MKLFLIKFLFFSAIYSGCSSKTKPCDLNGKSLTITQNQIKESENLKNAYQNLSSSPYSIKYQKEFFTNFPKNFTELNNIFGYTDKEPMGKEFTPGPLYIEAETYINAFFNLKSIDKNEYYNRIIDISINGRWYADGVNYFRHGMKEKVIENIEILCELLSKRNNKEIKSFWYFYFDSPNPIKELPVELQKVKEIDSNIFCLIENALNEVKQNWKR